MSARSTPIILFALLLLIGAALLYDHGRPEQNTVIDLAPERIDRVTIRRAGQPAIALTRVHSSWWLDVDGHRRLADQTHWEKLLSALVLARSQRRLPAAPAPVAVPITLEIGAGAASCVVELHGPAPDGAYFQRSGLWGTTDRALLDASDVTRADFIARRMFAADVEHAHSAAVGEYRLVRVGSLWFAEGAGRDRLDGRAVARWLSGWNQVDAAPTEGQPPASPDATRFVIDDQPAATLWDHAAACASAPLARRSDGQALCLPVEVRSLLAQLGDGSLREQRLLPFSVDAIVDVALTWQGRTATLRRRDQAWRAGSARIDDRRVHDLLERWSAITATATASTEHEVERGAGTLRIATGDDEVRYQLTSTTASRLGESSGWRMPFAPAELFDLLDDAAK